jgi:hypothetical protein
MTTQGRKRTPDLRLKIAIVESRRTQRVIGIKTRIGEVRLSEIVRGRGAPPTALEKDALAKYLGRAVDELFSGKTRAAAADTSRAS